MRRLIHIVRRRLDRVSPLSWGLLGLLVGFAGGLIYAWLVQPGDFARTDPSRLNEAYLADYLFLVSQSYAADGDWVRAEGRLLAIDPMGGPIVENEVLRTRVAAMLEEFLRQGRPLSHVENMARLARRLGVQNRAVALFAPDSVPANSVGVDQTSSLPRPTPTPWPTPTPLSTLVTAGQPTPTPRPAYTLLGQERACDEEITVPRIEVVVVDDQLEPVAGVEVIVRWDGGEDRFYTGFMPRYGLGYADFDMTAGVLYQVELADGSPPVEGLSVMPCAGGQPGGWRLTFQGG